MNKELCIKVGKLNNSMFKEVKYRTFERPAEFFLPGLKEQ